MHRHLGPAQLLQRAVGQRRGAHAAAGEGQEDQQVVRLAGAGHLGEVVAGSTGLGERRGGGPVGAACEHGDQGESDGA